MRLNAHILMDELKNQYPVTYYGPEVTDMHLKRPEIYNIYQTELSFQKNRTYCLAVDTLPEKPIAEPGTLLICIGYEMPEQYRTGQIRCIWLRDNPIHIIEIFNTVQQIFDKFDGWEYQLQSILNSTASIQEMVDCCADIFANPIIVIDASLRFLGYSGCIEADPTLTLYRPGKDGKMQLENLSRYLSFRDIHAGAGPMFFEDGQYYVWDVWLNDRYLGNMTIPYVYCKRKNSDHWLLLILEQYISQALSKYINNPELRANVLRNIFQDLLEERPLSEESTRLLSGFSGRYLCLKMDFQVHTEYSQPVSFYCSYIENTVPHSVCFAYHSSIAAFVDMSEAVWETDVLPSLRRIAEELRVCVGISNPFGNLSQAKYYYQQATSAIKLGMSSPTSSNFFFFRDYMLSFLLQNATGGLPIESLYSDGLLRLLEHDASSKVSFSETLLIYLRNSMNITKTALDLRIHRSSFLERLRNIEALLGNDLDNPQQRLYLQIILERLLTIEPLSRQTLTKAENKGK